MFWIPLFTAVAIHQMQKGQKQAVDQLEQNKIRTTSAEALIEASATDTQSVIESIAGDTAIITVDHLEVTVEAEDEVRVITTEAGNTTPGGGCITPSSQC